MVLEVSVSLAPLLLEWQQSRNIMEERHGGGNLLISRQLEEEKDSKESRNKIYPTKTWAL
jgi:hypothetical protein